MKLVFVFLVALLLLSVTFSPAQAQQDVPSIDLEGYTWNETTLHALIVTDHDQSWWQPYFVNLSQRAINQWNQAFQFFATKYPEYDYLSSLIIVTEVSDEFEEDYDLYINFSDSVKIGDKDALGVTTTFPRRNGTVEKTIITLSAKSGPVALTTSDQRDVATHELGHALGLGHSNSSADLMYPYYDLLSTDNAISTLDLYGVATIFSWVNSQDNAVPSSTTLPPNVDYEYAPILDPSPKSAGDNPLVRSVEILLNNPYMLIMVVALTFFLIVAVAVFRSRRKHR